MNPKLVFLIGAPRSGTTMLERILASHSQIKGGPEPHLLTPLAHLGYFRNVERAPYDHIVAALGQKDFVAKLPHQEKDYFEACRAYCETLYGRYLEGTGKSICLDKTPEYATVLPFITKVLPSAKYVVLTRHPAAIVSSFANSFFDGNYAIAQAHDPVLKRYVPALAHFLRQREVPYLHVRYEDFVADPETALGRIYEYIGVSPELETLDYSKNSEQQTGLGDPIGIKRHSRPSTDSLHKWADELAADSRKLEIVQKSVAALDPADLQTLGYPIAGFWEPLEERDRSRSLHTKNGSANGRAWQNIDRYSLERKAIVHGRSLVQHSGKLRDWVKTLRLACDVLLREY